MWTIALIVITALIVIGVVPPIRRRFFNTAFGQKSLMIAAVLVVVGVVYLARVALGY